MIWDVLGYIPEFKHFADAFPENEVLYQIGYHGLAERDALYVRKLRGIIDELSEDEKKQIDPVKLAYLEEAENRLGDS